MASIIHGYEYDIFISYRQKDNKHDGWVTKFVDNLKGELEATLKEDVSVYFDENPHDGLQDTHNVDKSLEGKLKCLIFIPILSKTYCDPTSYAWQYEYLAFLRMTEDDRFGRDVRIKGGNVASRILPIRIHDLEQEDVKLFEKETGSVLRAMDFVFKTAAGVNRPLKANEDHPQDNLNKTFYSDQINKVANSIDAIIHSLKEKQSIPSGSKLSPEQAAYGGEQDNGRDVSATVLIAEKSKRWMKITLAVLICLVGLFVIYKLIGSGKQVQKLSPVDKSIAVLPFANDSPDKENEYFCNGMMEEILNQLQKISALQVKARTSVEKYRNTDKDIKLIGQELGVSLIMEGSVRKAGDDIRITTQLINTKTGNHLWSETYDGKYTKQLFEFQSSVAKKVAVSLNAVITPQEEKRIDVKPTSEMLAYDLCSRADEMLRKWRDTHDSLYLRLAVNLVNQALKIDPKFINAFEIKGGTYEEAGKLDSAMIMYDKAQSLDPTGFKSAAYKADNYFFSNQPDSAFKYCKISLDLAPNDIDVNFLMGYVYLLFRNEVSKGLLYFQKAYNLGADQSSDYNQCISNIYYYIGNYAKALKYSNKAISLRPECDGFITYSYILSAQGRYKEALQYLDSTCNISDCDQRCDIMRFHIYTELKEFNKAEGYYKQAVKTGYKQTEDDYLFIAYLYNETERKKEAASILTDYIKRNENLLNRPGSASSFGITGFRLSAAYAMIGEKKKALKYITYFNAKTEILLVLNNPRSFPGFDSLRSDPEFKAFLQRIEDEKSVSLAQVREMEQSGEINL